MRDLEGLLPPVRFTLDGCDVTIYEVLRSDLVNGERWYHVTLDLEYRGKRCRRFNLDAKSTPDFRKRLLVEIAKFKLMVLLGEMK